MTGINRYRSHQVHSASKPQVLVMLYEEAIRQLIVAADDLDAGEGPQAWPKLHKARSILVELTCALDDQAAPEICANLRRLYQWCMSEVAAGGNEQDPARVRSVIRVLRTLLDGWRNAIRSTDVLQSAAL